MCTDSKSILHPYFILLMLTKLNSVQFRTASSLNVGWFCAVFCQEHSWKPLVYMLGAKYALLVLNVILT